MDRPGSIEEVQVINTPTKPQTPTSTPTFVPTYTPTPEPLGQSNNPIIMGFIQPDIDEITRDSAATLIDFLYSNTGLTITSQFFISYQEAEEALMNNQLHFVWFNPIEYILASNKLLVRSALVTNHLGVTSYGIRILSHIDAPYTSFFDEANNVATADIYTALTQFSGSRPCFVQEPSLTGNLIPIGLFLQASIPFSKPVITFATSANLRALYIK
ncbi:MAG: PhnD/SsuA/transferrin family substrate-binding protein, partial [Anaerolineaceae bacterium]|nr:PhnD/SsuA/transferrin family substrate-binding protein [Anaerolineaceae bacterium]